MQQPTLQVHGSSNNDNVFMVDGVQIQHIGFGGNQTGFYFNDGLMEEISYQTSSLPAEAPVGGVQINMIPRDGGNVFHGGLFATGANGGMQSNNLSQDLVDLGFKVQNRVQSVYDINATLGGPVLKDRLWFFSDVPPLEREQLSGQHVHVHGRAGGRRPAPHRRHASASPIRRADNNKFSFHYDRSIKWRGHRPNNWLTANINDPISDVVQTTQLNYIGEIKWSSPISNRLLAEASLFTLPVNYTLGFEPDAAPGVIATFDQIRSIISGVSPRHGHRQRADVHLSGQRVVCHRIAQPEGRHAGAHRLVAGAVHDARRHAADHEQRRAELGAAREHAERPQGIRREHRHLRAGFVASRPA